MKKITVIIPFLNEGEEIYKTVKNIRETSGEEVAILLVNDASTDGTDYKDVAEQFRTGYIEHKERCGVAFSRDEAIEACDTFFFLLLDGHMRFLHKGWSTRFIELLESDRRAVFCGQTKVLFKNDDGTIIQGTNPPPFGAFIDFERNDWKAFWSYWDPDPDNSVVDIPVILGASYACNKAYWQRLGGLEGLKVYGLDEQFISLKTWMEGGRCRLLKDLEVEHLYRKSFPYEMTYYHQVYNQLLLSELLLPENLREKFQDRVIETAPRKMVIEVMEELLKQEAWVDERRAYYQSLFIHPFDFILSRHLEVKTKNNHK